MKTSAVQKKWRSWTRLGNGKQDC